MKANLLAMCFILSLSLANPLLAQPSSVESSTSGPSENVGGVKSLEDRVKELEKATKKTEPEGRWFERIRITGLIEVEAGYGQADFKDTAMEDEDTSAVDLATVELNRGGEHGRSADLGPPPGAGDRRPREELLPAHNIPGADRALIHTDYPRKVRP